MQFVKLGSIERGRWIDFAQRGCLRFLTRILRLTDYSEGFFLVLSSGKKERILSSDRKFSPPGDGMKIEVGS